MRTLRELAEHGLTKVSMIRYMKSALRRSRTLAYGSATILAQVPIICTRSIGRCRGQKRWICSTKTWPRDTELALGQSMYSSNFSKIRTRLTDVLWDHRSSKSSNSRRPMMSSALMSNNYSLRTSSSHFLTVFLKLPARLCSPPTDLLRLPRR